MPALAACGIGACRALRGLNALAPGLGQAGRPGTCRTNVMAESSTARPALADNAAIATALREMAALLEAQGDNPFRVAAYRRAADAVARQPRALREVHAAQGLAGLDALPGVGPRIAAAIEELLTRGHWTRLERLRGAADPETLLHTVPGVGPELAHRLHDELGIDSLESLEVMAHAGRLESLAGIGPRRAAAIRATLTEMLDRQRRRRGGRHSPPTGAEPPVELLLAVDEQYRALAQAGRLPLIAPRRFNPQGKAWLPVLHAQRPGWHFTALYSNTARAHELGHVFDWVVIYAEDERHHEQPFTVVTAPRGALHGRRVVRGREAECSQWYATPAAARAPVAAPAS